MVAYKPRILVVENDEVTLRRLETTLKIMGATTRCLRNGRQAALLIKKEKFDGAFLDWELPELNGEELTRRIRHSKSNKRIPIAMLTAPHDLHAIGVGFKAGVTFFLSKPVGARELARLLNASRGAMLAERRRYQRVPLRTPVLCKWGSNRVGGQSIDISTTGMHVTLPDRPPLRTRISLEFTLPRSRASSQLSAQVVRAGAGGQVGLKFLELEEEEQQRLMDYVTLSAGVATPGA